MANPLTRPSDFYRINYWIHFGTLGITATVYTAWQYGLRDGSSALANPKIWRGIDARLPYRAWARVHAFLEKNFLLGPGDEDRTPWTLLTSCFSHRDVGHLLANLISFNSACNMLDRILPPVHLVGLMLSTGLGGSAGFLAQQSRNKFSKRRVRGLGMSGITTGLGVALAVLRPRSWVSIYQFPVPIWFGLGFYLVVDAFLLPSDDSNVGHAAHLGGGIAGFLYAWSLKLLSGTLTVDSG